MTAFFCCCLHSTPKHHQLWHIKVIWRSYLIHYRIMNVVNGGWEFQTLRPRARARDGETEEYEILLTMEHETWRCKRVYRRKRQESFRPKNRSGYIHTWTFFYIPEFGWTIRISTAKTMAQYDDMKIKGEAARNHFLSCIVLYCIVSIHCF